MSKPESKAEQQQLSDERVAKLIKAQKRSGMSVAAFAREHGVPVWKLYQAGRARRRRRRKEFIEVAVSPKEPDVSPLEVLVREACEYAFRNTSMSPHFADSWERCRRVELSAITASACLRRASPSRYEEEHRRPLGRGD